MSRGELVGWLVDVLAGLWIVNGAYIAGSIGAKNLTAVFCILTWPFLIVWTWYQHILRNASDD